MAINIRSKKISSRSIQKLLGIDITAKLSFDNHVKILCSKGSQKLNALPSVAHHMDISQRKVITKAFIFFQFGYCPLVWMFHSRRLYSRKNNIHERALRIMYRDRITSFEKLLKINLQKSKEIYRYLQQKNLKLKMDWIQKSCKTYIKRLGFISMCDFLPIAPWTRFIKIGLVYFHKLIFELQFNNLLSI